MRTYVVSLVLLCIGLLVPATAAGSLQPCGNCMRTGNADFAASQSAAGSMKTAAVGMSNPWSTGPKRILFMRLTFQDDPSEPITAGAATNLMAQTAAWYSEKSYGLLSISSDITPLLTLPNNKSFYSFQSTRRLLEDARLAAAQSGYDTNDYDFDVARFNPVPLWNFAGTANIRGKGLWLQSSDSGVLIHELGHNLGLEHANFWSAGADSIIGPGTHVEYGNIFDIMGQPPTDPDEHHFNACWLNRLGWLNNGFVATVTTSGVYRLHALDVASLVPDATYALKIRKDQSRDYWAEFRQKFADNVSTRNGILLNWSPWLNSRFGTHLLDMTPGSPSGDDSKEDAALIVGRTLSDLHAGVHITPTAVYADATDRSIDVQVHLGSFSNNVAPALALTSDRIAVGTGENVQFTAAASDFDGDALAYHWDFGDLSLGSNAPTIAKAWSQPGEYSVRCTVSDMKGGLASRNLTITVGSPAVFQISGRVADSSGIPAQGVRVHNGAIGSEYRGVYSDTDGYYSLVNLPAGTHTLTAVNYGHNLLPASWSNPVTVGPGSASNRDWLASPYPPVSVIAADASATESESGSDTGLFTITRFGSIDVPLTVRFTLEGTAELFDDYTLSAGGSTFPYIVALPVGVASTNITVTPFDEFDPEGTEIVILTLIEDVGYTIATNSASVAITDSIGRITPFLDWENPADIVYGTQLGPDQLNAFAFEEGTFTYDPPAGTILNAGSGQQLQVIFTPDDLLRYEPVTNYVTINVAKKSLTITANDISTVHGAPIMLTASYQGFVNEDTEEYLDTPPIFYTDANSLSGVGSYLITVSGASDANYAISFFPGTLTITRASTIGSLTSSLNPALLGQSVTFTFTASAVAPSIATPTGPVRFRIDGATYDMPSLVNGAATITTSSLSLGTHSVTAEYSGTPNFSPTIRVLDPEQLIQSPPTITWPAPLEIVYGTELGPNQLNATCSVPGTFVYDPPAGTMLNAGQGQILSVTFTPTDSNFPTLTTNVLINILKKTLTVTATDQTKVYGASLPSFNLTYVGFVNGDTVNALDSLPSVTTAATASSPVGNYPLIGVGGADLNYAFGFADGTLDVTPAPLTITAVNTNKVYGAPLPLFAATYTGFVNGDVPENLDTPVALTTAATIGSDVGNYAIEAAGATDLNYAIQFVNGTLEVSRATSAATLSSSLNPALPGEQVTFAFSARPVAPSVATPTGTALFKVGATTAEVPLVDGVATFSSSTLAVGSYAVEVEYSGNANWIGTTNRLSPNQLINTPPVAMTDQIERRLPNGAKVMISTLLANDADGDGDSITFMSFSTSSANGGVLVRQGDWLHYSAPAGFTNNDSFTYTITDGRGDPVTGIVQIRVNSGPVPSPNLSIAALGNGSYRIRFDGIAGVTYRIEFSASDMTTWQPFATNTANEVGLFEIVDTPPPGATQRVYRSVHP